MANKYDVGYGTLDAFKRLAQAEAAKTDGNIERLGLKVVEWTRGESVFLVEHPDRYIGHVNEGLGTKNLVADRFFKAADVADDIELQLDRTFYDHIAQDAVAMIVNDMITIGVLPVTLAMHVAVYHADWFRWTQRYEDLLRGWRNACDLARCVWGPGETPALRDLISVGEMVLSGSADGVVTPKERLIKCNIQNGDAIVFLESSGIHANGLTLARDLAKKLPDGYLTELPDGRTYGETLLDPTHIYVGFVEDCLNVGIEIHYGVNITGHGWRKLMRAPEPFTYAVEELPPRPPIFDFLEEQDSISRRNMYADFNMGAGFALYVPSWEVDRVLARCENGLYPFKAHYGGVILASERREVKILMEGIGFDGDELQVR